MIHELHDLHEQSGSTELLEFESRLRLSRSEGFPQLKQAAFQNGSKFRITKRQRPKTTTPQLVAAGHGFGSNEGSNQGVARNVPNGAMSEN